jgi:hypothetical protein
MKTTVSHYYAMVRSVRAKWGKALRMIQQSPHILVEVRRTMRIFVQNATMLGTTHR